MRIEQLELKNFKCFPSLKLTFKRPINLIFGQNASGKTTIAQAMELALTGRYGGTTPDFRVRNILTKNGTEEFSISLALVMTNGHATSESASLEIIQKTDINRCRPKPDVILEKLQSDKEVLAALLNTRHFLQAHPDQQKQLLFDLLDIKVNQSNLPQQFRTWLKNHPEVFNKYAISPDDDLLSCLESRPKNLEEGYQDAFEERKLIKRELKSLIQTSESANNLSGPNLESLTAEAVQSRIDQGKKELCDLQIRIGETRGIILGEGKQIEREISEISGHKLLLQQDFKSFDSQKETDELNQLEKKKGDLTAEIQSLKEKITIFQHRLTSLEAEAKAEEKYSSRFKKFDGGCPLFEEKIVCDTKEVLDAISRVNNAPKTPKLTEEINMAQKEMENLQKQRKSHEGTAVSLEGGITFHQ